MVQLIRIKMKKTLGFTSLFLAAMSFGSFGIWIRLLNKEISIYQQIVLRNSFALVIVVLIVLLTKQFKNIEWKKMKKLNLALYIFLIPLAVIAYNIAMINAKIAIATFAFYVGTILTGWFAGIFFYQEKLNREKLLALFFVILGLGLFAYPFSNMSINLGFIAGIVSGVLDGAANIFRKDLAGKISKLILVLLTAIGGVFVSGIMMLYFKQSLYSFYTVSATTWIVGAFFGFLLIVINYLLLLGFQNFDLGLGSIVLSL